MPDEDPPSPTDPLELPPPELELLELPDPLLDDEPFELLLPDEPDAVVPSASSAPPSPTPEPVGSLSVVPSTPCAHAAKDRPATVANAPRDKNDLVRMR